RVHYLDRTVAIQRASNAVAFAASKLHSEHEGAVLRSGGGPMKFALRTAFVIAFTYVYLRLIYLSDWIDEARKSPAGQKVYFFLADLVNAHNADEGERVLLAVYFIVALVAACLTVWAVYRFVVRPVRSRSQKSS